VFWKFRFPLFTPGDQIDMDYLSVLSQKIANELVVVDKEKHHWLKKGLKTYLETQYLKTYFPESKLLGHLPDSFHIFGLKPLKWFNASNLKLTERYGLAYQYMVSQNLDQAIASPFSQLSNFNQMVISDFEMGSLFNFVAEKMKPQYFDDFLKSYLQKNSVIQDSQDFFIGYRKDLGIKFTFPRPTTLENKITLEKAISDLKDTVLPAKEGNYTNGKDCKVLNHEYMIGGFSSMFMSRNRVRSWDEVSFTIQAGGRHAPIHPQAPKMNLIEPNIREFVKGKEHLYRRLSVRECARIQTFPDTFSFEYKNVVAGYKMIGNAVPVKIGKVLAEKIYADLDKLKVVDKINQKIISSEYNGNIVIEKLNEIVNRVTV
jgi:hypothetical protein